MRLWRAHVQVYWWRETGHYAEEEPYSVIARGGQIRGSIYAVPFPFPLTAHEGKVGTDIDID